MRDALSSRGCLGHPQPNDRLKGDDLELPLNVAACTVERSTSKGKPMAELLVDFITSLDGYASAVG